MHNNLCSTFFFLTDNLSTFCDNCNSMRWGFFQRQHDIVLKQQKEDGLLTRVGPRHKAHQKKRTRTKAHATGEGKKLLALLQTPPQVMQRYPISHPRAEQTRGPSKTGKAGEAKRENPSRPGRENEPSLGHPRCVRRLPFPINTEPPPPPPSPKPSPKPYSIRQLGFLAASTSCRR
jgi:hypothetical protein